MCIVEQWYAFWVHFGAGVCLVGAERSEAAWEQPSRIPKASMWYDSDTVAGRGLSEVDDFEVIREAAVEAAAYHRLHHRSLGDRRQVLKTTIAATLNAA